MSVTGDSLDPSFELVSGAVRRLESWLETMRVPAGAHGEGPGYGGPVVHWWRDSVVFCGPGYDWRYEGIIHGFVTLFRQSGDVGWLTKAVRAGDELIGAQLPSGTYRLSRFEQNPGTAGTPHEGAVDAALLALASKLRSCGDARWTQYAGAARRNLVEHYIGRMWDDDARWFRDTMELPSFVPNKAATLIEALLALEEIEGQDEWSVRYARPTVDAIVRLQAPRDAGALAGGIPQNVLNGTVVEKYFPLYVARCIPALIQAGARFDDDRYVESALEAGRFLLRWRESDGGFPQVIYADGRVNRYPRWIAAMGDILRALELLTEHGLAFDSRSSLRWLLDGQRPTGAVSVAQGFESAVSQRAPHGPADARDLLPVAGWCDKAFRYLAAQAGPMTTGDSAGDAAPSHESDCTWRGIPAHFRERREEVVVHARRSERTLYRWRKGERWALIG